MKPARSEHHTTAARKKTKRSGKSVNLPPEIHRMLAVTAQFEDIEIGDLTVELLLAGGLKERAAKVKF